MTRVFFSIFVFLLLQTEALADPFSEEATETKSVLAVQTFHVQPYDQAVTGFEKTFTGNVKRLCICDAPSVPVPSRIEKSRYDLFLCVGLNSLTEMVSVHAVPVIYLMVLAPPPEVLANPNYYGISMTVRPKDQLDIVQKVLPGVKTIGLLYGSQASVPFVKSAKGVVEGADLTLMDRKIEGPKEFVAALKAMNGQIDMLWMIPDLEILSGENMELLLLMAVENKIPILAFSDKFLDLGAFMSISVDASDMGKLAGNLAGSILARDSRVPHMVYSENPKITVNTKLLEKLDIEFNADAVDRLEMMR